MLRGSMPSVRPDGPDKPMLILHMVVTMPGHRMVGMTLKSAKETHWCLGRKYIDVWEGDTLMSGKETQWCLGRRHIDVWEGYTSTWSMSGKETHQCLGRRLINDREGNTSMSGKETHWCLGRRHIDEPSFQYFDNHMNKCVVSIHNSRTEKQKNIFQFEIMDEQRHFVPCHRSVHTETYTWYKWPQYIVCWPASELRAPWDTWMGGWGRQVCEHSL